MAAKFVTICVFLNFQKNEKKLHLNWKISVMKVQKSKIWDDRFLGFSVAVVVVYSIFSVDAVFMEKFVDQNCQYWKFSKKNTKKGVFIQQNLVLRNNFYRFFPNHLVTLSKRIVFHPQTFIKDTKWVNISSTWLVYKLSQLSTSLSYMCTIIAIKHIHQNFNFDIWAT